MTYSLRARMIVALLVLSVPFAVIGEHEPIINDAEYRIIERQHDDRWIAEDKDISTKPAKISDRNEDQPLKVLCRTLDDVGYNVVKYLEMPEVAPN